MDSQLRKTFLTFAIALSLFAGLVSARDHQRLNGTWNLAAARSEFGGEPAIQTGTVTIYDREHNIYVSRNFSFDDANQSVSYSYKTDARENHSIREGKTFKSKAKWEGDALKVVSTADNITSTELYRLNPDGTLTLTVERPGHATANLLFERQ